MPGPALAEVGRGQIAVDEVGIRRRGSVAGEARDLGRRRRQAPQVERQSPDERGAVRVGRRLESRRLEPRQQEAIDGRRRPRVVGDGRRIHLANRLPGPVRPPSCRQIERRGRVGRIAEPGRGGVGPRRPHLDPPGERRDVVAGQGTGGRHQHGASVEPLDERARLRAARHDDRPGVAPLQQPLATVEAQPAERRVDARAVAGEAVVGQEWPDGRLEELGPSRGHGLGAGGTGGLRRDGGRGRGREGQEGREGQRDRTVAQQPGDGVHRIRRQSTMLAGHGQTNAGTAPAIPPLRPGPRADTASGGPRSALSLRPQHVYWNSGLPGGPATAR